MKDSKEVDVVDVEVSFQDPNTGERIIFEPVLDNGIFDSPLPLAPPYLVMWKGEEIGWYETEEAADACLEHLEKIKYAGKIPAKKGREYSRWLKEKK